MEGPLLVLKSWWLAAMAIWVYKRWFQRSSPPTPEFEAFCASGPVVAAFVGAALNEQAVADALAQRLGKRRATVATLGTFPWPHYKLAISIEVQRGAVMLRVTAGEVTRNADSDLPALASVLRDLLNEQPGDVEAWLCAPAFSNGLVAAPAGGWSIVRGASPRPQFLAREAAPERVATASLGLREPDAPLLASRHRVHDAVPRVAREVEAAHALGDGGARV
jgi:hypothetical protein